MIARFTWKQQRRVFLALAASVLLVGGVGCQTCSLSKEDFQKQQNGEMADLDTGKVVSVLGTLAYCGGMIAAIVVTVLGK